jgi:hypothetical protein
MKNARICRISEYEETDKAILPDERYEIRMAYYDQNQLKETKKEYDKQVNAFTTEVSMLWDVEHAYYESKKRFRSLIDFTDLSNRLMGKEWKRQKNAYEQDPDGVMWNELGEMYNENSFVEKNNRTYEDRFKNIKNKLTYLRHKLSKMHGYQHPVERVILDERITFLEERFNDFTQMVNPHHIQPGLVLDINITTVKRKRFILKSMANCLNEFLYGVSKGFADAAFATYSRRRSTVRADIDQSFASDEVGEDLFESAYKQDAPDMGDNGIGSIDLPGPEVTGSIDLTPAQKPAKKRSSGLKEL